MIRTLLFLALAVTIAEARQPNVVFILADDLGWADTTLYGQTSFYQTPNIEKLAARGMTFSCAYSSSPLCSPTRSAIITGLSPARTGITNPNCHVPQVILEPIAAKISAPENKATGVTSVSRLKTEYRTLAESLKDAGYATGHFGKWHLGPKPYSPLAHGFDVDVPQHPGPGPAGSFVAPWKYQTLKPNSPDEHIEDRMAGEAVAWMEQHKDRPFFLNYWMFSVHAPFDAKSKLIEKYRAKVNPESPQKCPTYAAMVESMDDAIGTLMSALDRLGLTENTIMIFTSDNGGNMYNTVENIRPTSNAPLRGGKATIYEGGTRVPCVVAWPGMTKPGTKSDSMVQSEDYYPTLLAGIGIKPAEGQSFDGISIEKALKGEAMPERSIFQYFPHNPTVPEWLPPSISVHRGDWKLIRVFHGGENQSHQHLLYNLKDDIGEATDLSTKQPEIVARLSPEIDRFLAETKATVPLRNLKFDPEKYQPEKIGVQPKPKAAGPLKDKPARKAKS